MPPNEVSNERNDVSATPSPRPQALRPHERLRRRADFKRVFGGKRSVSDSLFVVYADRNGLPHPRVGVIVSRKVSRSSVTRHRVKRLMREAFRINKAHFAPGVDFAIVARTANLSFARVQESLTQLTAQVIRRLGPAVSNASAAP